MVNNVKIFLIAMKVIKWLIMIGSTSYNWAKIVIILLSRTTSSNIFFKRKKTPLPTPKNRESSTAARFFLLTLQVGLTTKTTT
jgi:uncharacterized membrane protein